MKTIFAVFMLSMLCINVQADSVDLIMSTTAFKDGKADFIWINPGQSSSVQMNFLVTTTSTQPWRLNVKGDSFNMVNSTLSIPSAQVTYAVLKSPCDDVFSYWLPTDWTTAYTASTGQYKTNGTTVTLSVNISTDKILETGKYRSSFYYELVKGL